MSLHRYRVTFALKENPYRGDPTVEITVDAEDKTDAEDEAKRKLSSSMRKDVESVMSIEKL